RLRAQDRTAVRPRWRLRTEGRERKSVCAWLIRLTSDDIRVKLHLELAADCERMTGKWEPEVRFADHTPSGEPISRGCEGNGDFRQLASGSKDLCILASVM